MGTIYKITNPIGKIYKGKLLGFCPNIEYSLVEFRPEGKCQLVVIDHFDSGLCLFGGKRYLKHEFTDTSFQSFGETKGELFYKTLNDCFSSKLKRELELVNFLLN